MQTGMTSAWHDRCFAIGLIIMSEKQGVGSARYWIPSNNELAKTVFEYVKQTIMHTIEITHAKAADWKLLGIHNMRSLDCKCWVCVYGAQPTAALRLQGAPHFSGCTYLPAVQVFYKVCSRPTTQIPEITLKYQTKNWFSTAHALCFLTQSLTCSEPCLTCTLPTKARPYFLSSVQLVDLQQMPCHTWIPWWNQTQLQILFAFGPPGQHILPCMSSHRSCSRTPGSFTCLPQIQSCK